MHLAFHSTYSCFVFALLPLAGERFGAEAVSATGTLWDMIRESGTGAGDAVREVSEVGLG